MRQGIRTRARMGRASFCEAICSRFNRLGDTSIIGQAATADDNVQPGLPSGTRLQLRNYSPFNDGSILPEGCFVDLRSRGRWC